MTEATATEATTSTAATTTATTATTAITEAAVTTTAAVTGEAAQDWTTGISDPLVKSWVTTGGYKDVNSLAQSAFNLEKLIGVPKDRIVKLPSDDNKEAWDKVYTQMGRPETADKYNIPVPEGDSGDFAKVAKGWFHEAGLSESQATKLAELNNAYLTEQMGLQTAASTKEQETQLNLLKAEWGGEFQSKAALVDRAGEAFGMTPEQLASLKATMGPAAAMKFMHNIGSKLGVAANGLVTGESNGFSGTSPEQAKADINTLRNDRAFIAQFNSKDDKTRFDARAKMDRLHKIAYPESA